MSREPSGQLLDRLPFISDACDLDLIVFLCRHPRMILSSEQIAAYVGYDLKQVAKSLDAMMEAGILKRTQNPVHAARLYILALNGLQRGPVLSLVKQASTPLGRRQLIERLQSSPPQTNACAAQDSQSEMEIA
jgi:hypothetical protein